MTLQQLTYLVTVAECGNITDAAERLFLSQPSLSAAIHNLEKEMGVTAFVRSNKGVTVTQDVRSCFRLRACCSSRQTSCRSTSAWAKSACPSSACHVSTIRSR